MAVRHGYKYESSLKKISSELVNERVKMFGEAGKKAARSLSEDFIINWFNFSGGKDYSKLKFLLNKKVLVSKYETLPMEGKNSKNDVGAHIRISVHLDPDYFPRVNDRAEQWKEYVDSKGKEIGKENWITPNQWDPGEIPSGRYVFDQMVNEGIADLPNKAKEPRVWDEEKGRWTVWENPNPNINQIPLRDYLLDTSRDVSVSEWMTAIGKHIKF